MMLNLSETNLFLVESHRFRYSIPARMTVEWSAVHLQPISLKLWRPISRVTTFFAEVSLMLTGAYFELIPNAQEGRLLSVEIHIVAQLVCSDTMEQNYISDAYSNVYRMDLNSEDMLLDSVIRKYSMRETVRDLIETPDPVHELIYVYQTVGNYTVTQGNIKIPVLFQVIYRNESGSINKVSKHMSIDSSIEIEPDMNIKVTGIKCAEVYASVTASGLEIKMPVDIDLFITMSNSVISVVAIDLDLEDPVDSSMRPSVTVINPENASDLWSLAKQYGSTSELIAEANDIDETEGMVGKLLLIPKEK